MERKREHSNIFSFACLETRFDMDHDQCKIISKACEEGRFEYLVEYYKANKQSLDMTHCWSTLLQTLRNRWLRFRIPVEDSYGKRIRLCAENPYNGCRDSSVFILSNNELLKYMIKAGADIRVQCNYGQNLLMIATSNPECYESIQTLIDNGADLNAVDCHGFCALTHAVLNENEPAVELLLKHGSRATQPDQVDKDNPICYPLIFAIYSGDIKVLNHLRHYNTIVPSLNLEYLLYTLKVFNFMDLAIFDKKVSLLYLAFYCNQIHISRLFLEINFLTHYDCVQLQKETNLLHILESSEECTESLDLYRNFCFKPKSLFTLSFVTVSHAVGFHEGRETRVKRLEIPECLQRQLLFKTKLNPMSLS